MKKWSGCLLAFLLVATLACPAKRDAYGTAGATALAITDVLHTAADTVDQLRTQNAITVDEERQTELALMGLNNLDIAFGSCVQEQHKATATPDKFAACVNVFAAKLQDPEFLKSIRVSNPKTQALIQSTSSSIASLLSSTITSLEALKQTSPPAKP